MPAGAIPTCVIPGCSQVMGVHTWVYTHVREVSLDCGSIASYRHSACGAQAFGSAGGLAVCFVEVAGERCAASSHIQAALVRDSCNIRPTRLLIYDRLPTRQGYRNGYLPLAKSRWSVQIPHATKQCLQMHTTVRTLQPTIA
jgi:hypothetical protein